MPHMLRLRKNRIKHRGKYENAYTHRPCRMSRRPIVCLWADVVPPFASHMWHGNSNGCRFSPSKVLLKIVQELLYIIPFTFACQSAPCHLCKNIYLNTRCMTWKKHAYRVQHDLSDSSKVTSKKALILWRTKFICQRGIRDRYQESCAVHFPLFRGRTRRFPFEMPQSATNEKKLISPRFIYDFGSIWGLMLS